MTMFLAASITQAQLSNVPKRYRSANGKVQQHRESGTSLKGQQQMLRKRSTGIKQEARKLVEESLSLPTLDQATFDLSSMQITESRVDISSLSMLTEFRVGMSMSMPITESDFDFSMSLSMMERPTETLDIDAASGDGNNGEKFLIYAGFLVGASALLFAATAMFVKMRHVHALEVEGSRNSHQDIRVY